MVPIRHPVLFLRRVLLADAAASAAMGALMLLGAGPLAGLLGLPGGLLRGAGLALLPFAGFVAWLGLRAGDLPRAAVLPVVAVNALWVVDSVLLLLGGWVAPTGLGTAFVLAQALAVALLAALQALGLRAPAARPVAA